MPALRVFEVAPALEGSGELELLPTLRVFEVAPTVIPAAVAGQPRLKVFEVAPVVTSSAVVIPPGGGSTFFLVDTDGTTYPCRPAVVVGGAYVYLDTPLP